MGKKRREIWVPISVFTNITILEWFRNLKTFLCKLRLKYPEKKKKTITDSRAALLCPIKAQCLCLSKAHSLSCRAPWGAHPWPQEVLLPQLQGFCGENPSHFCAVCFPCHISSPKAALIATPSFINRSELPLKKDQAFFGLNGGLILQGSAKTAIVTLRMTVVCAEKVAQFFPKKNEHSHGNQHVQTAGHEVKY